MRYEEPELIELGSVEELTFGGEVTDSIDRFTFLRWRLPVQDEPEGDEE
jgi:hypothetical protein